MIETATGVLPGEAAARSPRTAKKTMKATVFHGVDDIRVEEVPRPVPGPGEALLRVTLTTICGTDLHIVRGEYPVRPGLIIGHEPVGVIEELGPGVTGYEVGERVLVGAITPCNQCGACFSGHHSQCGHSAGYEAIRPRRELLSAPFGRAPAVAFWERVDLQLASAPCGTWRRRSWLPRRNLSPPLA